MDLSKEQAEERKQAVFERMSPRRQRHIKEKIGYDNWDPFMLPNDPIDIRRDKTKRTSQMLIREFLQSLPHENYSPSYGRAAFEMCLGLINEDERYQAMFDFAVWYNQLLQKEYYQK